MVRSAWIVYHTDLFSKVTVCSHSCRMGGLHSIGQRWEVTLTVLVSCSPQELWWTWVTRWVSDTELMCLGNIIMFVTITSFGCMRTFNYGHYWHFQLKSSVSECLYCSMYIHIVLSLPPLLQDGDTPLMVAAFWGRVDTLRKLLSSGASPLCTNIVGTCTLSST